MNTKLLDEAIHFAVEAHKGVERKEKGTPYILHTLEAAAIAATMTDDQQLLAAAVLHDVLEDTEYTAEDLERRFGKRVTELVINESDELDNDDTWHERKAKTMARLKNADRDSKIVAMGDKLSNMRAIAADYQKIGDALWNRFHVKDPKEHAWHYRTLADALSDLSDTDAYKEFAALVNSVFPKEENKTDR